LPVRSQYFQLVATLQRLGVQVKSQYLPLVATAHKLGIQVKSQYKPEVATVHKSQLFAYGFKSDATNVQMQVVYQQLLAS
jgi:hypothetical protein